MSQEAALELPTIPPFEKFFRDQGTHSEVPDYIEEKVAFLQEYVIPELGITWWSWLCQELELSSQISEVRLHSYDPKPTHPSYPNQGLVLTGYEGPSDHIIALENPLGLHLPHHSTELELVPSEIKVKRLDKAVVKQALYAWLYYLELLNHPERLAELYKQSEVPFKAPNKKFNWIFFWAKMTRQSITIRDLALSTQGAEEDRAQRTARFINGPFVNYGSEKKGRMQARSVFASGANPDAVGNAMALSTLTQAHSLANLPRDGFFSDIQRQVDLAKKVFEWNRNSPVLFGKPEEEKEKLLEYFNHNLVGVVEASKGKAVERATALYEAGVRTFRIYSPEPGNGPLETLKALRKLEKENGWERIEIFAGQVISLKQAKALEAAGADGIYIGIGGGGRCITGIVGNLTIDWPQLLWEMRGQLHIPVMVEGGANDAIGVSLVLGASVIGVTGKLTGNIESPGGYLVFVGSDGLPFVYYGGEAANRMRAMAGRLGPFGRVEFEEGETRKVFIVDKPGEVHTLLQMLLNLHQGVIGAEVFQNAVDIPHLQEIGTKTLRRESPNGAFMKETH